MKTMALTLEEELIPSILRFSDMNGSFKLTVSDLQRQPNTKQNKAQKHRNKKETYGCKQWKHL
jgi:hypothetical protein